ncbi:phosphomannomutase/phosphoglucomutase [Azospirillum sp. RWY-5-1]|uniref:Phosphomannomutase/phosphoglucomutase n=1 Tax=Azospirillum oleiclasticum TaxID=2735135 RepID=A0ABX2T282_9PROT|nr:phosphomannomutase/phosphoglucomutase [Azospirillum oleiclasticum]NYZ11177.1 phosphomannomutase/phosphoglucomutase [Azospirillum oleiclasticum]NYZ18339.1 phosphomannomutase/phosphoglucomutase [Azospirillum oleiclasticum]
MSNAHTFDPTVLREYDIRGIVGKTLTAADARAVGRAFGTVVVRKGGKTVCVGYDGRTSSPELEAALVGGLESTGLHVLRIGLGPTPMLYFATRDREAAAGIMITGSHNPPEYNGIKMMLGKGPVYGAMIQELGTIAKAGDFATGQGSSETVDVKDEYVTRLLKDYDGVRDLKVVWDAGNGATGEILRRLTAKLPGQHTLLFDEIDGTFPNHHPDPTVEKNLVDLKRVVAETGADIGIGFDGDGDRIGAIDHKGRVVWGDQLVAIYAADVLKSHPGATIIADVKASQALFDEIAKHGGKPLMWKTGHSLLKAKMAETGSPLAGEMSGHIFFADKWYGFDDALYCGVRLIGLVSKSGGSLADLRDGLPDMVNTPETRFQVDEIRKFAIVDEVKERLKAEGANVNDIDGVRVNTPDGWWLLRASNTQDVLVARAEAFSTEGLERLKGMVIAQLEKSGIAAPSFDGGGGH